ncbi:MAG TPA: zf-HC2 domain-containing protein [Bryobacteraceae bacterium]|nr:zf-HC2 domain-containing protein [Bryobacteraceae bacterium]
MHAVTMESLEEYLAGTLEPAQLRELEAHLSTCGACREEIRGMQEMTDLFGALRSDGGGLGNIPAGFSEQVMAQVGRRQALPAFASFFALNMDFGRRVVFASLLTLAVVGSYLVTREERYPAGPSPEAILAQQNAPGFEANAENKMLVTLAAYEH